MSETNAAAGDGHIAIVGNGAMGSLFARELRRHGDAVVLGRATVPGEIAGRRLVLILVKTYDTANALAPLREYLDPNAVLLTLQNGLDNESVLTQLTGRTALAGVTTESATRTSGGEILRGGTGVTTLPDDTAANPFARLLSTAGFDVRRTATIGVAIWQKLVANAAINSVTALARVTNGEVLRDDGLRARAFAIARETARIARAEGIETGDPVALVETVVRASAANRSSMLQDIERGRPTEACAILGAPLERARRANLRVPALESAYAALRARETAR